MELINNYQEDDFECDCGDEEYGCEECNEDWESEESVANGLGFTIGDDGHWIPYD